MKYREISFTICIIWMLGTSCNNKPNESEKFIYSSFAAKVIPLHWSSPEWQYADCLVIKDDSAKSENQLFVYSRWNYDSLYFFFKVTDSDLRTYQTEKDHPKLYLDDMVEILIDTQNDKDSCWDENDIVYHINLLGIKKDDRGTIECLSDATWDGVAQITVLNFGTLNDSTDTDSGYLMSLSFPWSEFEQKPGKNLRMGINFAIGDNDGKSRQLFDWVGAWPFRSPYKFGTLILTER